MLYMKAIYGKSDTLDASSQMWGRNHLLTEGRNLTYLAGASLAGIIPVRIRGTQSGEQITGFRSILTSFEQ